MKYRLPRKRTGLAPILYGVLVVAAVGLAGWISWQAMRETGRAKAERRASNKMGSTTAGGRSAEPQPGGEEGEGRKAKVEVGAGAPQWNKAENEAPRAAGSGAPAEAPGKGPAVGRPAAAASNELASIQAEYAALKASRKAPTNAPTPPRVSLPEAVPLQPAPPDGFPRPVADVLEAQLALDRLWLSPGSLDGQVGGQTRAALRAYQQKARLPVSGELDSATQAQLVLSTPPWTTYTVAAADLARLQPLSQTWLGKSEQSALEYETILELLAEKGHAYPNLIRRLNPNLDWASISAGTVVQLPEVSPIAPPAKAAFVTIRLGDRVLEAFDANDGLLAHFPCSIARHVEKRPVGELRVAVIAANPNYTFDPEVFPESAEARQLQTKLLLPPGPKNPVGVAWIGLDKPGYGIHGTPNPEQVGRTESHGCFRLANWNAERLLKLVWVDMPVRVLP